MEENKEAVTEAEKEVMQTFQEEEEKEDLIELAKQASKDLKQALEERKQLVEREERLLVRQEALRQLGGGSFAGSKPKKKIETPEEYKERVLKGEI
jgi:gamma-glutamyl:cysteine ligase YbdK (ATP-grasp superfamily)